MGKLRYMVDIEYLDEDNEVWDSDTILDTDNYDAAVDAAMKAELKENQQAVINEYDDEGEGFTNYEIIKKYGE